MSLISTTRSSPLAVSVASPFLREEWQNSVRATGVPGRRSDEARRRRAEIKELLKNATITLPELFELAETDEFVDGMKVKAVLASLPGLGKVKSQRLMQELEIAENRRVRGLGSRQREALLAALS